MRPACSNRRRPELRTAPASEGSLLELTRNGERPIVLADGSERGYLEDGDEVVLRGSAGDVALGEVSGRVLPASRH